MSTLDDLITPDSYESMLDNTGGDSGSDDPFQEAMDELHSLHADALGGDPTEAKAAAKASTPAAYSGGYRPPDGSNVYQNGNGTTYYDQSRTTYEQTYGRHGQPGDIRASSIDARAPLGGAELKSRNDTSQFFASKNGAVTQNDLNWARTFNNGPTAQRATAAGFDVGNNAASFAQQFQPRGISAPGSVGQRPAVASVGGTDISNFGGGIAPIKVAPAVSSGVDWPEIPRSPLAAQPTRSVTPRKSDDNS